MSKREFAVTMEHADGQVEVFKRHLQLARAGCAEPGTIPYTVAECVMALRVLGWVRGTRDSIHD